MRAAAISGTTPDGCGATNTETGDRGRERRLGGWLPGVGEPVEALRNPLVKEGANAVLALKGCVKNHRLANFLDWRANQAIAA